MEAAPPAVLARCPQYGCRAPRRVDIGPGGYPRIYCRCGVTYLVSFDQRTGTVYTCEGYW